MGFFSWQCSKSDYEIPAYPHAELPKELSHVVLVLPNDETIEGYYDGYGRIDGKDAFSLVGGMLLGFEVKEIIQDQNNIREKIFADNLYDQVMKNVKIVRKDYYNGEKFNELKVSKRGEHQGYFFPDSEVEHLIKSLPKKQALHSKEKEVKASKEKKPSYPNLRKILK